MTSPSYLVIGALLCVAAVSSRVILPSYVKTCSRNDPKLNECALKHGREVIPKLMKGDPSIRLPPLEPLSLDRVEIHTNKGESQGGLKLVCYKCNFSGLSQTKLNDIKIDLSKKRIEIKLSIPRLSAAGKYDVNGKLLLFPITGKGLINLTLSDLEVTANLEYKLIKKKAQEHIQITKQKVDFTSSRFKISLSNLFNGDKLLGETTNQLLNDNWEDVLKDLKPSISNTVGQIIQLILNNILDIVSYDDFLPPK